MFNHCLNVSCNYKTISAELRTCVYPKGFYNFGRKHKNFSNTTYSLYEKIVRLTRSTDNRPLRCRNVLCKQANLQQHPYKTDDAFQKHGNGA